MRLYGKNSVIERLRANPASVRKIYIEQGFQETAYIYKRAKDKGIPVVFVPRSKMIKIARNLNTQGILVDTDDFFYQRFDDLLENAVEKKNTLLFLDGLTDPQNLGAIVRSVSCLGNFAIVLPTHDSVEITESVLRVASGGDNYVPVAKIGNLVNAIKEAKEKGYTVMGAVVKGGQPLYEIKMNFPVGLVVGSEQKGIRDVIRKHLDLEVTIPMKMDTLSYNVAHATTIVCYEITRQKKNR